MLRKNEKWKSLFRFPKTRALHPGIFYRIFRINLLHIQYDVRLIKYVIYYYYFNLIEWGFIVLMVKLIRLLKENPIDWSA